MAARDRPGELLRLRSACSFAEKRVGWFVTITFANLDCAALDDVRVARRRAEECLL